MTYIPSERRQKSATVRRGKKNMFPVDSKKTASSAIKLMGHAKPPLSSNERAAVKRKAAKFGVKPKEGTKASKK